MGNYVGVDLGGTKIAAALFDTVTEALSGELVVPTHNKEGADGVLNQIAEVVREVCSKAHVPLAEVSGVGVGVPGTFDADKGETDLISNIPGDWNGKPVVAILNEKLGIPVALVNDARSFTLAEATLGAGRGYSCVIGLTLGTGIGGGISIDGKLHLGLSGSAGEIGHHSIDMHGVPDNSGNPGGWETYASGPAIAAMGVKAVMQGANTTIGELVNYDLNKITPRTILQAAEKGDTVAQDILRRAGEYVGAGLANFIIILAPNCVVIGGGMAELGEWIMQPMREQLKLRCNTLPIEQVAIKKAALGSKAGIIGAALQAKNYLSERSGK
jgi:glucokinase